MLLTDALLVGAGAFAAGAMNAIAGGGTFFSFPAMLAVSNETFLKLVPWLLLVATTLFAFAPQVSKLTAWMKRHMNIASSDQPGSKGGALVQLIVAIYGGFFGAGMGILTLAALSIQGFDDVQEINALKNMASAMNYTVAALTFIIAGAISWPHTLVALITAAVGGHVGAVIARKLPNLWLKRLVILVGALLTVLYFLKTY
jgi:uncharacterized membrane protein YfcA